MTNNELISLPKGTTHLSVISGVGGTTLGLQLSRESILQGKHVFWISNSMPDATRFSQIFESVPYASSSKFHVSEGGDKLEFAIISTINVISAMNNVEIVIVDDWAPKTGKVSKSVIKEVRKLAETCERQEVALLLISSAYESADGVTSTSNPSEEGWRFRIRGGKQTKDFVDRVWWLNHDDAGNLRNLWMGNQKMKLKLDKTGFVSTKNADS